MKEDNTILAGLFEKRKIETIGVVGMGYVGIPSAVLFASSPAYKRVYGFQRESPTSGYKIDMLNSGKSPLDGYEPKLDNLLERAVTENKFICTSDFSRIAECDAITVAVQTPVVMHNGKFEPDFSSLTDGLKQVGKHLSKGTLVVIESTVTPGTTTNLARRILESESGLVCGIDFGLSHAPERVTVGSLIHNIRNLDRVIGGINKASTDRTVQLYSKVMESGSPITMDATAAEVTKTAENAFRDLQIAAVNELAL